MIQFISDLVESGAMLWLVASGALFTISYILM